MVLLGCYNNPLQIKIMDQNLFQFFLLSFIPYPSIHNPFSNPLHPFILNKPKFKSLQPFQILILQPFSNFSKGYLISTNLAFHMPEHYVSPSSKCDLFHTIPRILTYACLSIMYHHPQQASLHDWVLHFASLEY